MKHLIPIALTLAAIIVTITTAVAGVHGAFIGNTPLKPYLYAYGAAGVLILIAIAIATNTARKENESRSDDQHKQIKTRLAPLIKRQHEIYASLKAASDNTEYTELIRKAVTWADDVTSLLREIEPTDAEIFSHAGQSELSAEQLGRVAHVPPWKRAEVARFLLYIQTLDQIRSNRRL